jgi:hypothetical protein
MLRAMSVVRARSSDAPVDEHLAIEAPGPQQRRVQDLRPVRRAEQDDAAGRIEAIELDEQLVERLLLLVVPPHAGHRVAGAPERVQLVDEDDGRRLLAGLLEQVAHPGGSDADEHLDELGPADREERDAGLARHGAGQQRLARARGADEQDAFRHARAEPRLALRVLQELDDFLQLGLGLIHARHVAELRLGVGLDVHLRLALADGEHAAGPAEAVGHTPGEEGPDREEQQDGHHPRQDRRQERALDLPGELDLVLRQRGRQPLVDTGRHEA